MVSPSLYYPFQTMEFEENKCFLTGVQATENITVFPEWFMQKYQFDQDDFEMMDKIKSLKYKDLKLPSSEAVKTAFERLDTEVKTAMEAGYEGMLGLDSHKLFLWLGRIVYGTLYHEAVTEKKRHERFNKNYEISTFLKERFGIFHLFLQSLLVPMEWEGEKPWSILLVKHKFSSDIMNYRDDTVNLMFSLATQDFALIACLQDNGAVAERQKDIVEKIGTAILHPIQFEELYARFHYANYLLQYEPKYSLEPIDIGLKIKSLPVVADEDRPLFGFWDEDMFASVLAGYWAVYGVEKKEILKFPNPLLSFLEDPYTKDFIQPEKINLPF